MDNKKLNENTEINLKNDDDFSKVIEESKQKIHETGIIETKKRNRGRPQKTASTQSAVPLNNSQPLPPNLGGPVNPPPDITPFLVEPLIAVSKIPARNHGIKELALTKEEAQLCATALNECLKAFVPDMGTMSPKTAAVIGLFVTVGSVGFSKYQVYLENKPREEIKPEPTIQELNAEAPKIDAGEYFRKG